MVMLFRTVFKIFHQPGIARTEMMPPHAIDPLTDTINGMKYFYQKSSPEVWTQTMKFLLWNLKYLQCKALQLRINELSP
jgi:hypothetical protein